MVFILMVKNPLLFALFFYILYFFITINRKKKWASGLFPSKPLGILGFLWPNSFLKVGKSPEKVGKIVRPLLKTPQISHKFNQSPLSEK